MKTGPGNKNMADWEGGKMLKKVTADIKAAVVLIANENVAALRTFVKNVTSSVFKTFPKQNNATGRGKKRP